MGLLASPWNSAAESPDDGVIRLPFVAEVTVAADGSVALGAVDGLQPSIAQVAREQLTGLPYVAAAGADGPVQSEAYVQGRVWLLPAGGDEYAIELHDVAVASARAVSQPRPRYPSDEFQRRRSGHVELVLEIAADGSVANVTTVSSRSRSFEKAARDAVVQWRYETRGRPARLVVPFWFYREGSDLASPPAFACVLPEGEPRLQGQGGCEPTHEVVLVPMKTVEGAVRR